MHIFDSSGAAYGSRKKKAAALKTQKSTYAVCVDSICFPKSSATVFSFINQNRKSMYVCMYVHVNSTFFFMVNAFRFWSANSLGYQSKAKLAAARRQREHYRKVPKLPVGFLAVARYLGMNLQFST